MCPLKKKKNGKLTFLPLEKYIKTILFPIERLSTLDISSLGNLIGKKKGLFLSFLMDNEKAILTNLGFSVSLDGTPKRASLNLPFAIQVDSVSSLSSFYYTPQTLCSSWSGLLTHKK